MTVRQSRATLDRGRANSHQGQQPGDAGDISSIGPPPGYEPTPTRLQELRQQISDARRAQLAQQEAGDVDTLILRKNGKAWSCACPICGRMHTAPARSQARGKTIDHIAREHR